MSDYIKRIRTTTGDKQIDYTALANLPTLVTVDNTLTESGKAADAKVVGEKFTEVNNALTKATDDVAQNSDAKYANILKGHAVGQVVRVDDVSPIEHVANVRVESKNLVPYGTITFTKNKNFALDNPLPVGTYTISATITSNDTDGELSAVSINSKSEVLKYITLKRDERVSSTFTVTKPITNIDFCAAYNYSLGGNDTATWSDIQLEVGDTATEYTPYIDPSTTTLTYGGETYTPNSDGSVEGLISTYPAMEMSVPDGFNVFLEYNQDTNAVIKKLTDAIVALGGTV